MPVTYNASRPNYRPPSYARPTGSRLVHLVNWFLKTHPDMTEGRFGQMACNNFYIVRALRTGANPLPETEGKIRAFIEGYGDD